MVQAIKGENDDLKILPETNLGEFSDTCPRDQSLWSFTPDAFIVDSGKKLITIFEFTRGMADWNESFEAREAKKRQAYHGVRCHVMSQFPDFEVRVVVMVMGVLCSVRQSEWRDQLEFLGIEGKGADQVMTQAMQACIEASASVLAVRAEKIQAQAKAQN